MKAKLLLGALLALGIVAGIAAARIPRRSDWPPGFESLRGLAGAHSNDVLSVKMERCAEQAMLDAWSRYRILLQPRVSSLPDAEAYLERVSLDPQFQKASEKDRLAEALIAGGFIGEAIRRDHGGEWLDEEPGLPEAGSFALRLRGHSVWPVTWAQKRLFNGAEDNVYHKYLATVTGQTNGLNLSLTVWTNGADGLRPLSTPVKP